MKLHAHIVFEKIKEQSLYFFFFLLHCTPSLWHIGVDHLRLTGWKPTQNHTITTGFFFFYMHRSILLLGVYFRCLTLQERSHVKSYVSSLRIMIISLFMRIYDINMHILSPNPVFHVCLPLYLSLIFVTRWMQV